ncbi:TPA: lysis protein [Vibrio vulnificus]|nr:lysis protein [Vibrio vulnificus]ELV8678882.1 lysis protein [Vibrio vulnificus]HAS6253082.1 lysis protein [Vibrio vulnificus]HDY8201219.1 lysis protein [Vibrio vulnificus]
MQSTSALKLVSVVVIIAVLASVSGLYAIEKERRVSVELQRDQVTVERDELIALNEVQQDKIQSFNELSIKHSKEMADAQKEMDALRDDLRVASKRVYVKADCPAAVPSTDTTRSVGDAATARLSERAEQDYLRLRQMISDNMLKIRYLQGYIATQCQPIEHGSFRAP